jgi:hypothetical protein
MTVRFMTRTILFTLVLLLSFVASVDAATAFKLDDQRGETHTQADIFSGKPVVMYAGMERKTPDSMEAWDRALRAKAPPTVKVVGLSNLEAVPFFVPRRSIKKTLVKQFPKTVVLCDWEGDIYSKLGFPKGATIAVAVFDANGIRRGLVTGEVNDERMAEVLAFLPE